MRALPAVLSITELAALLGVPRHMIRDHADAGRIPTFRLGGDAGKRLVSLAALRRDFPELWDAVMLKADAYEASVFTEDEE